MREVGISVCWWQSRPKTECEMWHSEWSVTLQNAKTKRIDSQIWIPTLSVGRVFHNTLLALWPIRVECFTSLFKIYSTCHSYIFDRAILMWTMVYTVFRLAVGEWRWSQHLHTVHMKSSKKLCRGSFFFCKFMNARSVLQVFGVNRSDRINRLSESDDAMRIMLLLMSAWGGWNERHQSMQKANPPAARWQKASKTPGSERFPNHLRLHGWSVFTRHIWTFVPLLSFWWTSCESSYQCNGSHPTLVLKSGIPNQRLLHPLRWWHYEPYSWILGRVERRKS